MDDLKMIVRIASKLFNDGLTSRGYSITKANEILSHTVNPVYCKKILAKYEILVIEKMMEFEAQQ